MSRTYSLVVAVGPNNVIGNKTSLLWHSKKDFEFFKTVTMNKPCIFGDTTFFNLPRYPLKNRLNIVASLNYTKSELECNEYGSYIKVPTIEDGFVVSENFDEVVICGGRSIYDYVLKHNLVNKIYFSTIESEDILNTINNTKQDELVYFPTDLKEYCKNWTKLDIENFDNCTEDNMNINFNCYVK